MSRLGTFASMSALAVPFNILCFILSLVGRNSWTETYFFLAGQSQLFARLLHIRPSGIGMMLFLGILSWIFWQVVFATLFTMLYGLLRPGFAAIRFRTAPMLAAVGIHVLFVAAMVLSGVEALGRAYMFLVTVILEPFFRGALGPVGGVLYLLACATNIVAWNLLIYALLRLLGRWRSRATGTQAASGTLPEA